MSVSDRGLDIWGTDSFEAIYHEDRQHSRRRRRPECGALPIGAAPYEDGSFDCIIICNQVLEHVPDPAIILADAYRLLCGRTARRSVALPSAQVPGTRAMSGFTSRIARRLSATAPPPFRPVPPLAASASTAGKRAGRSGSRARRSFSTRSAFIAAAGALIGALIERTFNAPTTDLAVDYMRARLGQLEPGPPSWTDTLLRLNRPPQTRRQNLRRAQARGLTGTDCRTDCARQSKKRNRRGLNDTDRRRRAGRRQRN